MTSIGLSHQKRYKNGLNYGVFGCEIIVLGDKEDVSDAEELTRDLMALLASFSSKYYGRRSLERRKKNKNDNRDK